MPMTFAPSIPARRRARAGRSAGLSLLELLVAMALGLVVVLAVMSVLVVGEANKRTTTGTNDMNQSGGFSATALDRALRSAGAGFSQGFDWGTLGCQVYAARDGTNVLPPASAFPAPFAALGTTIRVAPVLIGQGLSQDGSDILVTMGGSAPVGDIPRLVRGNAGTQKILLDNTVGLSAGDVLLLSAKSVNDCVVTQVDAGFGSGATATGTATAPVTGTDTLPLGGRYYRAATGSSSLSAIASASDAYLTALGNDGAANLQMQMFGVGTGSVLYRYDLLNSAGSSAAEPLSEGVYAMRAVYGVDTNADGVVDSWVKPTGAYAIGTLAANPATLRTVVAVRVALLLRSTVLEKPDPVSRQPVGAQKQYLFNDDANLRYEITLPDADRNYRYRVLETTVPLRNLLMKQPPT